MEAIIIALASLITGVILTHFTSRWMFKKKAIAKYAIARKSLEATNSVHTVVRTLLNATFRSIGIYDEKTIMETTGQWSVVLTIDETRSVGDQLVTREFFDICMSVYRNVIAEYGLVITKVDCEPNPDVGLTFTVQSRLYTPTFN